MDKGFIHLKNVIIVGEVVNSIMILAVHGCMDIFRLISSNTLSNHPPLTLQ